MNPAAALALCFIALSHGRIAKDSKVIYQENQRWYNKRHPRCCYNWEDTQHKGEQGQWEQIVSDCSEKMERKGGNCWKWICRTGKDIDRRCTRKSSRKPNILVPSPNNLVPPPNKLVPSVPLPDTLVPPSDKSVPASDKSIPPTSKPSCCFKWDPTIDSRYWGVGGQWLKLQTSCNKINRTKSGICWRRICETEGNIHQRCTTAENEGILLKPRPPKEVDMVEPSTSTLYESHDKWYHKELPQCCFNWQIQGTDNSRLGEGGQWKRKRIKCSETERNGNQDCFKWICQTDGHIDGRCKTTKWNLEIDISLTGSHNISVYKSDRTGLTLALSQTASPIVRGYFCLSTETQSNRGLPHTLEHLISLGSSGYPYKGTLDMLSNRCLADRTNAWTATDHTCYTVSTAGSSGFLNILPIYLDHILHPTLHDGDYDTEVHRISGEGEDVGVVYGEMQGIENNPERILSIKLFELLYPEDEGYFKETGGRLKSIREETNIENVRKYHRQFYRPENLFLTITGPIDSQDIFDRLKEVEDKWDQEKKRRNLGEFQKPWQKTTPIPPSKEIYFEFSSEDETSGYVRIGWRKNLSITENIEDFHAQKFLLDYLTLPQVGPLDLELVNTEDSIATSVLVETENFKQPLLILSFTNVPSENLSHVAPKMEDIFESIYREGIHNFAENHLMSLHGLIDNEKLRIKKDLENTPQTFVPQVTNIYQLYGNGKHDFEALLNKELLAIDLKEKPAEFWLEVLKRTLIDAPKAVVKGVPSKKLQESNNLKETERILDRNSTLNHQELKRAEEKALSNQIKPTNEIIEKVPLADVNDIVFQKIKTFNTKSDPVMEFNFKYFPFEISLSDVDSSFVQFYIVLSTKHLSERQKRLLPVLLDVWLYSPLIKSEDYIPLDEVLQRRDQNILGFYADFGIVGEFYETVVFEAQCKLDNLEAALEDIHDALLFSYPDPSDVEFSVIQKLDSVPETKQSPLDVEFAIFNHLVYSKESNLYLTGFIEQTPFLEDLLNEDFNTTVEELRDIMKNITSSQTSLVYISTDVSKLIDQHKQNYHKIPNLFRENLDQNLNTVHYPNPPFPEPDYSLKNKDIVQRHIAVGVSGTDSCYLKQVVDFDVKDWNDPEVAQVEVLLRYISDRLYDRVRGPGFTYGVEMSVSVSEGHISLDISRSPQLVDAVREVKNIFSEYSRGNKSVWETTLLDSSKGSIIFEKTQMEETVEDLVVEASKGFLRKTGPEYNRNLIKKLADVSIDDLSQLSTKYLAKFFSYNNSLTILTCSPASIGEIVQEFNHIVGFTVTEYDNIDEIASSQIR